MKRVILLSVVLALSITAFSQGGRKNAKQPDRTKDTPPQVAFNMWTQTVVDTLNPDYAVVADQFGVMTRIITTRLLHSYQMKVLHDPVANVNIAIDEPFAHQYFIDGKRVDLLFIRFNDQMVMLPK